MYYTGVGSRKTPVEILEIISQLGAIFSEGDFILRSGGAPGADEAFERRILNNHKDIFLPWKGFNNHDSTLFDTCIKAFQIAEMHHDYWSNTRPATKKLLARNVHQVLGLMLDRPSEFVMCYTPDGAAKYEDVSKDTGGTGMAIKVAAHNNIPIWNLGNPETLEIIKEQYKIIV